MAWLCRVNDYDQKFRQVLGHLASILEPNAEPRSHTAPFIAELRRHLARIEDAKQTLVAELGRLQHHRQSLIAEIQRLQASYEQEI
jgi:hypothetical protein